MNSIEELENMGIERENAIRMLEAYEKHIGERHGDYLITGAIEGSYTCECMICHATRTISVYKLDGWKTSTCSKHYVQDIKYDGSYIGKKNNMLEVLEIARNKANKKVFLCKWWLFTGKLQMGYI